jgi:hypothetical protein
MKTTKKMQDGGPADAMRKAMGQKKPSLKKTLKYVKKNGSGYIPPSESNKPDTSKWEEKYVNPNAKKMQKGGSKTPPKTMDEAFAKRYPNYFGKGTAYDSAKKDVKSAKKDVKSAVKGAKTVAKTVVKALPSYQAAKGTDDFLEKRYPNYFGKGTMYSKVKKGVKSVLKKGGIVKKNKAC